MKKKYYVSVAAVVVSMIVLLGSVFGSGAHWTQAAQIRESGTCGENLTWTLDDAGLLSISGSGPMDNWQMEEEGKSPWKDRDEIKAIAIGEDVTSIGSYAFYNCRGLTEVTIPAGVKRIGSGAFSDCRSLVNVSLSEGLTYIGVSAFSDCSLVSVMIPEGVTEVDNVSFWYCRNLTSVVFPASLAKIGTYAFNACSQLQDVFYNGTEEEALSLIGDDAVLKNAAWHFCGPEGYAEVRFDSMGGMAVGTQIVAPGKPAVKPADPVQEGMEFGGWYLDPELETEFDFTMPVTKDLTVYAKWVRPEPVPIETASVSGFRNVTYNGRAWTFRLEVTCEGRLLEEEKDYTVRYANNTNAGTADIILTGIGAYTGTQTLHFTIAKAKNPLKVKKASATYKRASLKTAKSFLIGASKGQGRVTYSLNKNAKKAKLKVSIKGKVTVPKYCRKGTYKIIVQAAGTPNYKPGTKTVTVTVK